VAISRNSISDKKVFGPIFIFVLLILPGLPDVAKNPNLGVHIYLGGPWYGKCGYMYIEVIWNILQPLGVFYEHLVIL
jgi:hypothetical protein